MRFKEVETVEEVCHARKLIEEYAAWLCVDLCFQNLEEELRALPGEYGPPNGRLLLALREEQIAGCIAIRSLTHDTCEMKRLYVRPAFRGLGLGKELVKEIIDEARSIGFQRMRLDTLPRRMPQALALYRSFGFKEIGPYYSNGIEGTLFMELDL